MLKSSAAPALLGAILAIGLLLTAYVGGYYWLTTDIIYALPGPPSAANVKTRYFKHQWQVQIFQPAASLESAVCGEKVSVDHMIYQGGVVTVDFSNVEFSKP